MVIKEMAFNMQTLMLTLFICSVTVSVLALLYMATTPLLSKRYSEKGHYYAWLVIVVALIIPFRPQWSNPFISVGTSGGSSPHMAEIGAETATPFAIPVNLPSFDNTVMSDIAPTIPWWHIAFVIWLAGVGVFVAYHGIKHRRFTKTIRRWSEPVTDKDTLSLLQTLRSEMGINKQIPIYLCPYAGSPMLLGLLNPRILLPTIDLAQDELGFILKHELVHYKRKDLWYKHLVIVAWALHWFNPLMFLIARTIEGLCEKSCDTKVVQHADGNTRQSYGETIIGVVAYKSKWKTALSTGFYSSKNGIKNRISTIMDERKKRTGTILVCVAMVLAISGSLLLAVPPTAGATEGAEPTIERIDNSEWGAEATESVETPDISNIVVENTQQSYSWSEIAELFSTQHQIENVPTPSYLPEGFAIENVWLFPVTSEGSDNASPESANYALYIRIGNGAQSFDIEIMNISESENVFDTWMQDAPETTINGRRVISDSGWLSVQIDENIRYTFMWGAAESNLTNPLGDDVFTRIAESIQ